MPERGSAIQIPKSLIDELLRVNGEIEAAKEIVKKNVGLRRELLLNLYERGLTYRQISAISGLSFQRVHGLLRDR